jgi:hypothetical protein
MSEPVRAMAAKRVIPTPAGKSCACGGSGHSGECDDCHKRETLQRAGNGGPGPASVPASVVNTVSSAGRPLDSGARASMESRFGRDFSGVRVHTDHQAADSARAVNARAYTVGQHIAFDRGQYQPRTPAGQHLLAHELAHTVQQQGLQRKPNEAAVLDPALESRYEREANAAAVNAATVSSSAPGGLVQRTRWDDGQPPIQIPPAVELSAADKTISDAAEMAIVSHYLTGRDRKKVVSHQNVLKDFQTDDKRLRRLTDRLKDEFFTKDEPAKFRPRATASDTGSVAAEPTEESPEAIESEGAAVLGRVEGQRAERAPAAKALKAPDILDLVTGEVYDVTTTREAADKTEKIRIVYASLLNDIRISAGIAAPEFRPGTSLKPPPSGVLRYNFQGTRVIDYGPTDFDVHAGVIAYRTLEGATGGQAAVPAGEPYQFTFGAKTVSVLAAPAGSPTDLRNTGPQNLAASESIDGMVLLTLHRAKTKSTHDTIDAEIVNQATAQKGKQSKQPMLIPGRNFVRLIVNKTTGDVSQQAEKYNIPYQLRGLSDGVITKLDLTEQGLRGAGTLTPSIPLLRGRALGIAFGPDEFKITAAITSDKLKVPIPGFRVTQASIELLIAPEFRPSGTLAFTVGPAARAFLDGMLTITAEAGEFLARGQVRAHIPGVDETTGTVEYRPSTGWTGTIEIRTSKIPYVSDASVVVRLSNEGVLADGGLTVKLPGNQVVGVTISRRGQRWIYTGSAALSVPGLEPVLLDFMYDGEKITAKGTTGITVHGFHGRLTVHYRNGKVSGEGTISGKKGRANLEEAKIKYNGETGKFSGSGTLTYQITENLIATAGVDIPEVGPVKVKGALTFPKPIKLFDAFGDQYTIFKLPTIKIPVPGASIGPVGLVITIDGAILADYRIGPGQLEDTKIAADFQPFEESTDLKVDLQSRLAIPAHAGIAGSVRAALAIDAYIASVSGGITVTASVNLDGGVFVAFTAHYEKDRFTAQATPEITAGLVLGLDIDADVKAEAGIGPFSVETRKVWNLKRFRYDTGMKFGMKAPISYDSAATPAFTPPSLEKIQWVLPDIKPADMFSKIMAGSGTETTAG